MTEVAETTTPFAKYWRRTDVPHLTLHDRIHWVMQWVFHDPCGVLHEGRPATIANASQELVWIARTFGQTPDPIRPSLDEVIAQTRLDADRRARDNNVHRIGRSTFTYKKRRYDPQSGHASPTATLSTPSTEARDETDDESMTSHSVSSSAAVSEYLPAVSSSGTVAGHVPVVEPTRDSKRMVDGVSLQTMEDARTFRLQQRALREPDSEDSVSEDSVGAEE
ncbi:hypothetical protein CF319_g8315 [Tilletia indica]|nr:hypothetical protein CF319_g8315 [Tilletia indica]